MQVTEDGTGNLLQIAFFYPHSAPILYTKTMLSL